MASHLKFAFLVERPNGSRGESIVGGHDLTPEEAVQRVYDQEPEGTTIIKGLRGGVPDDLNLRPEAYTESEPFEPESDEDEEDQWDEDRWLDQGYKSREAIVQQGEVDDHLSEIEAVETSKQVVAAVEKRREQLEDDDDG